MKLRYLGVVVAITLLFLSGCACEREAPAPAAPAPAPALEPEPAPVVEPEEVPEGPQEVVLEEGGDVTEEIAEEKEASGLAVDLSAEGGAFPQASCALRELDGKQRRVITVKIVNTGEDEWVIYGKENPKGMVRVGNRGVVDIEPGCEPSVLQPGESATCTEVDIGAAIEGENRVTVNTPGQQYARVVICP